MSRVLIVEDSPTQAQKLSLLLEDSGFETVVSSDAESGFERAAAEAFDLVLTDVNLPGASGFDLCAQIKGDRRLGSIPVLVVTADSDPANVLRGLVAGADGFMTKDHSPGEIVRRVERTIHGGARTVREGDAVYTHVLFRSHDYRLRANEGQLLNVLLAAFEDVVELNERLRAGEIALRELNRDLRKTSAALEEANKTKDRFLGIAAHDLRNPLAVIQGVSSLLLESDLGPVNEEQTEALQRIGRQTESMLALLQDLLDVSALRSGKLEVKPSLQDPRDVLREAFDSFILPARQKGVKMVWEVPERLPPVEIDFNRILEVLSNLLSNGVKYCKTGESVHLAAETNDGTLALIVRDTGPGIQREELPRLFEPFAKLSSVPTAGEKSTGLGLSIVKEIVQLHGGQIRAESAPGRGSTFRIELPLLAAPAGSAPSSG